jgi:hypothetical protein
VKIDAKVVSDHLDMVSVGKRITAAVLGPNFAAAVVDEMNEVMLQATVKGVKFPGKIGVESVSDLAKILASFSGEVDAEVKDHKLVMSAGNVTVWYQLYDTDKISTTLASFKDADAEVTKKVMATVEPGETFIPDFARYQKLVSPDLVEFVAKGKKLIANLVDSDGHRAEVVVGAVDLGKKKYGGLKVPAKSVIDVLSGVKPGEGDQLLVSVGDSLRIEFRTYTFLIGPLVDAAVD